MFGWCPDSVHMLYWWCLDHVWTLSGLCLDGVWNYVWNTKYVWRVSGLPGNMPECVWNLSGQCLDSVWSRSTPCVDWILNLFGLWLEHVWTMSGWCPCLDHGLCMNHLTVVWHSMECVWLVSSQCWDVSVTCLESVWSLSVRPSNNSSLSGILGF